MLCADNWGNGLVAIAKNLVFCFLFLSISFLNYLMKLAELSPFEKFPESERVKLEGLEAVSETTQLCSDLAVPVKVVWGGRVHEPCTAKLVKKGNYRRIYIFLNGAYGKTPWISVDPEYYFK